MKKAFTMIELIFVIVILGILAAVAIPKLMATRTDAKVAAISQEVSGIVGEVPAYVTSQGKVDTLATMSQIAKSLIDQGKAKDTNSTWTGWSHAFDSHVIGDGSRIDSMVIGAQDDNGNMEDCVLIEINGTMMAVQGNSAATGAICTGIRARVKDGNYTIAGSSVKF
ncbi:type II secretion system protein [Nautilia sp.]